MLKRTIILLIAVLLLYAISDWQRFKDHVRPIAAPIRNWSQRQLDDDDDGAEAKTELIDSHDADEKPAPRNLKRLDISESFIVRSDASRKVSSHEFKTITSNVAEREDTSRLMSLREQLQELNFRDVKARRSRLRRIESELLEAEHEIALLGRESPTGDSSQLEIRIQLARDRAAQLSVMRHQLMLTAGD